MNEALPVKGVKVDGATVKDLKEYIRMMILSASSEHTEKGSCRQGWWA